MVGSYLPLCHLTPGVPEKMSFSFHLLGYTHFLCLSGRVFHDHCWKGVTYAVLQTEWVGLTRIKVVINTDVMCVIPNESNQQAFL